MKAILMYLAIIINFISMEVQANSSYLKKNPKIIVIGAGLSGLTTAYRLKQKGFDVHVYEAKKRVGGRIFTVQVQGRIAELGAQNILNGGTAKNVLKLVDEMELKLINRRIDFSMNYWEKNELLSASDLLQEQQFNTEKLKFLLKEIAKSSKNMQEVLLKIFDASHPLYKMLSVILPAYEGGFLHSLSSVYYKTLYHLLTGGLCAAHPGNENKKINLDILSIEGGNTLLAAKLAEKVDVNLEMPLHSISKNEEDSYDLFFKNGYSIKADIIVLAMPCPVYNDITFENGVIEEQRLFDIRNVSYGSIAKIVIPIQNEPLRRGVFINKCAFAFSATDPQILNLYL